MERCRTRVGILGVAVGVRPDEHNTVIQRRGDCVAADVDGLGSGDWSVHFETAGGEGLQGKSTAEADAAGDLGSVERVAINGLCGGRDDVATKGDLTGEAESGSSASDEQRGVAVAQCAVGVWQHIIADPDAARTGDGGGASVGVEPIEDQVASTALDEVAACTADDAEDAHFLTGSHTFNRARAAHAVRGEVDVATEDGQVPCMAEIADEIHVVPDAEATALNRAFGNLADVDANIAGVVDGQRSRAEGKVVGDVQRRAAVGRHAGREVVPVLEIDDGVTIND